MPTNDGTEVEMMALLKTDWTHELAQVKQSMRELLAEDVDPLVDRALTRGVSEMQDALNKVNFEIENGIAKIAQEVAQQRRLLVRDLSCLVVGALVLAGAIGLGLIAAYKFW